MSSTDGKTESSSQNKLDIEAFRHHLLNYRWLFEIEFFKNIQFSFDSMHFSNRSKVDDSESDIPYQFDFDSSFKRMLDEKRQMTNKENNPPAIEPSSSNPPEKPLRKDLLKDRKFWKQSSFY